MCRPIKCHQSDETLLNIRTETAQAGVSICGAVEILTSLEKHRAEFVGDSWAVGNSYNSLTL